MEPSTVNYKFYPSLLNSFHNYMTEEGYEKDGVDVPFETMESLINKINRVKTPQTEAQGKGKDFEDAVFGLPPSFGNVFDEQLLQAFREHLPTYCMRNKFIELYLDDVHLYGFADIVGEGKVVDVKTASRYAFPKYLTDHQNLYLLALKDDGVSQMDYVITNFNDVFKESYHIDNLDFSVQHNEIERFKAFCFDNRDLITDLKVFNGVKPEPKTIILL